ncbi:MAG: hypothetical protein KatS3mg102_0021 [Planctomycetota bacterium]|nr:MAG: hypothetical protein KatS3mg102_0021 [Planctomycetota bacterium]
MEQSGGGGWRHRLACALAGATLVLVFIGGLVTSTGSGLAVPDWPLSFGKLMPEMVGGVLYEHGHRMAAASVGLLTLVLCGVLLAAEPRRWVRWLGIWALFAVSLQGVLGGLTVRLKLPWQVSTAHGVLAQLFLCTTVVLAVATSRWWWAVRPLDEATGVRLVRVRRLALLAGSVVLLQLVLGALVRHWKAALVIPDFPLVHGGLVPPYLDARIAAHYAHRLAAVAVAALALATAVSLARQLRAYPGLVRLGWALVAAVAVQIALGAVVVLRLRPVTPTTLHVAGGALILALCTWLVAALYRLQPRPSCSALEPGPAPAAAGASRARQTAKGRVHGAATARAADLFALTKPGITAMVLLTAAAGYALGAPRDGLDVALLVHTALGTALLAAAASALNMVLEREADRRMRRTASRPLPAGRLRPRTAVCFALALAALGTAELLLWAGALPALLALLALAVYLGVYTPLKPRTSLNTLVGAVPGALPPLVGWAAARGEIGPHGWLLFAIVFLWQVPHFFAIAELYREDYRAAGMAMLPSLGEQAGATAARLAVLYASALLPVTLAPALAGMAGRLYFAAALVLGLGLLATGVVHARRRRPRDARRLFLASLGYLPALFVALLADRI